MHRIQKTIVMRNRIKQALYNVLFSMDLDTSKISYITATNEGMSVSFKNSTVKVVVPYEKIEEKL